MKNTFSQPTGCVRDSNRSSRREEALIIARHEPRYAGGHGLLKPKSETRNPRPERNPKPEARKLPVLLALWRAAQLSPPRAWRPVGIRISATFRISGIRIS